MQEPVRVRAHLQTLLGPTLLATRLLLNHIRQHHRSNHLRYLDRHTHKDGFSHSTRSFRPRPVSDPSNIQNICIQIWEIVRGICRCYPAKSLCSACQKISVALGSLRTIPMGTSAYPCWSDPITSSAPKAEQDASGPETNGWQGRGRCVYGTHGRWHQTMLSSAHRKC